MHVFVYKCSLCPDKPESFNRKLRGQTSPNDKFLIFNIRVRKKGRLDNIQIPYDFFQK